MIRINLLPTKAAQRKESVVVQLVVGAVVIVATLATCFVFNSKAERKIQEEQNKINDLNAQLKALQSIVAQVNDFKNKKRDLNKKIDTIKRLNDNRSGPVRFMEEFTIVLPRKSWITTFREKGKQLTLEGVALDGGVVADFVESLRDSKFFTNVQLVQSRQEVVDGKKMQRFNINCRVNYLPPGGKA